MSTVTSATNTYTSTTNGVASTATQANIGEEFNSFIQLLTAQVQNQDPLSPMDSTQFVEQLATFSTLEQQVRSNDTLESIASMISDLHSIAATDWLGQNVSVESSWVPYQSEPVNYTVDFPESISKAVLNIQDSQGNVVLTENLDMSADSFSWDGHTDAGGTSPDGIYQFGIDLYQSGTYVGTVAPRVLTTVTGVGNENGTLKFGTTSNLTTDLGNIRKE